MNITYDFWRPSEGAAEAPWQRIARIASTPPLRDYLAARAFEMTSKWMFRATTPMVVWHLTHDPRMTATALICLLLPGLVMEIVGGIVADRYDQRKIMMLSCLGSLACNLAIAVLAAFDTLAIAALLALTAAYGASNTFSSASSKTIVTAFVSKEDLATAVSLNSAVFNLAGFIGPALAAGLISGLGIFASYATCAALTFGFVVLLWRVPAPPREVATSRTGFFAALRDGLQHVLSVRLLLFLFILHVGSVGLTRPFIDFVPVIVDHTLHGGTRETGWMLSSFGAGSIFGALRLATYQASVRRLAHVAVGAMPIFAAALVGVAYSTYLPLALGFSFAAGFGMITRNGAIQSMLQLEASPAYRGRVMALYGVMLQLGAIGGALMIGQVAKLWSITVALTVAVVLLLTLWMAVKRSLLTEANRATRDSAE